MTSLEDIAKKDIQNYLKYFDLDVAVRKAKALRNGRWDAVFDKVKQQLAGE